MKKYDCIKYFLSIIVKSEGFSGLSRRQGVSSIALLIFTAVFIIAAFSFTSLKFSDKNDPSSGENLFSRTSAVILKTLGGAFSGEEKKPVLEIDLGKNSDADVVTSTKTNYRAAASPEKILEQSSKNSLVDGNGKNNIAENFSTSSPQTENNPAISPTAEIAVQKKILDCVFSKTEIPNHQIIFSEINWMGDKESTNNEWIEIKNNSGRNIVLNGWQILSGDRNIKIIFKEGSRIPSGELYLLERTDDNSAPGVAADAIYAGTLSNSGTALRIFDADCNLSDEINASKKWPAGNSAARRSMERSKLDLSWHTSAADGGTPKKENTAAFSKGTEEISQPANSPANNQTATSTQPDSQAQNPATAHILIAEVQITGGSGKTTNDFIKIFNPNPAPFNLKGYRLVKRTKTGISDTSIKSWVTDTFVSAGGYYIWANSSFTVLSPPADIITSGSIADDNGVAVRQGLENTGVVMDAVAWGNAQNSFIEGSTYPANPGANQILSRKSANGSLQDTDNNQNDFEIK